MPTYAELEAEQWWARELVPVSIAGVGEALRRAYDLPADAIGVKGDRVHLSGGHRSPEWIVNSRYSTRGTGDGSLLCHDGAWLVPGHPLWDGAKRNLRALDVTLGSVARMVEVCKRCDLALRENRLPAVRRFWGNVDGDQVVDGFDNLYDRATTSDSSHLWHLHLEWFPDLAHLDHADVIAALLGDDMPLTDADLVKVGHATWELGNAPRGVNMRDNWLQVRAQLDAMEKANAALAGRIDGYAAADKVRDEAVLAALQAGGGNPDVAPVMAALRELRDRLAEVSGALAQERAARARAEVDNHQLRAALAAALASEAAPPAGG
jgi:hypothetical protein